MSIAAWRGPTLIGLIICVSLCKPELGGDESLETGRGGIWPQENRKPQIAPHARFWRRCTSFILLLETLNIRMWTLWAVGTRNIWLLAPGNDLEIMWPSVRWSLRDTHHSSYGLQSYKLRTPFAAQEPQQSPLGRDINFVSLCVFCYVQLCCFFFSLSRYYEHLFNHDCSVKIFYF